MSNGHKGPFPEWNMEGMIQSQAQGEGPIADLGMVTLENVPEVKTSLDSAMILACERLWGVMPIRSGVAFLLISYTDAL